MNMLNLFPFQSKDTKQVSEGSELLLFEMPCSRIDSIDSIVSN